MKRLSLAALCIALALSASTVSAKPAADPGMGAADEYTGLDAGPGPGGPVSEAKREQVRKKIEAVRMWRMTEELNLDDKTSTKLAAFLSSIEDKRRELLRTTLESTRDLRTVLKAPKADESALKSALERIEKSQHELVELREKEIKGIKSMLSVEQQARYIIFQQEFRREMRSIIAGARGNGPAKGGAGDRMAPRREGSPPAK